jgi:hypothetical protein
MTSSTWAMGLSTRSGGAGLAASGEALGQTRPKLSRAPKGTRTKLPGGKALGWL